jgi:prophage regulatory protein
MNQNSHSDLTAISREKSQIKLLARKDVEKIVGMSRSWLYAAVADGEFPAPIHISPSAVRWLSSEVQSWIEAKIRERDTAGHVK